MAEERRARVRTLFDRAVELPSGERAAFLDSACGGDAGLRAEVEGLLAFDAEAGGDGPDGDFLKGPLVCTPLDPTPLPEAGQINRYRVLRVLGAGGMGTVYEAEQDNPRRTVALKVIRPDLASPGLVRRFTHEARILGRLQHPGIARVYEAGVTEDGRPYFAMELIRGVPLDEYAGRHDLDAPARLALLARVCDAVQHAHDKGVIHRDLKPANILVDDDGQPTVLDFGVARAADAGPQSVGGPTVAGQLLGTPDYMSPEQVSADPADLDARSDVYALGVILFELLAGRLPYPLRNLPLHEVARVIREQEPPALGSVARRFRGDVETIVAKALEKDKARRYASAGELAADVRRHLAHEPIRARRVSAAGHLVRWARRQPSLAALLVLLAAVAVGSTVAAVRFRGLVEDQRRATAAERWERYRADVAAAAGAVELHDVDAARAALDDAPEEHRRWEWRHFVSRLDVASLTLRQPDGPLATMAISPDGRHVATAGAGGHAVSLWDAATARLVSRLDGHEAPIRALAFSPDSRLLASGSGDGSVRLWDVAAATPRAVLSGHRAGIEVLSFSADGTRLASGSADREARLWEAATGKVVATLTSRAPREAAAAFRDAHEVGAALSPDGGRLAAAEGDVVRVRDVAAGRPLGDLRGHASAVRALAFSPDGTRLVSAARYPDLSPRLWDLATGRDVVLRGHKNTVLAQAFSPDGKRIATGSRDRAVGIWDADTGRPVALLPGHTAPVVRVLFSPNGAYVVSASWDHTLRLWDATGGDLLAVLDGHRGPVDAAALGADGQRLASLSQDGTVRLWDVAALARNTILRGHGSFVYDVAFSPDGEHVASAAWDGTVRVWEATTGRQTAVLAHPGGGPGSVVVAVMFSPDGKELASVARDDRLRLWDAVTGRCLKELPLSSGGAEEGPRLAFRPGGDLLAAGGKDGVIRLWRRGHDGPAQELRGTEGTVLDVAFSPDGATLASVGMDRQVRLWDVERREPRVALGGHQRVVYQVAFSHDGRLIASCSEDGTVRLWDAGTHEQVAELPHAGPVYGLAFSPDGERLATACRDGTIRLWDPGHRAVVAELRGHTDYVHAVAFSPDGTRLVSGSGDFTVRVWDTLTPRERAAGGTREGRSSP
jgi:WD40 repeat protein/predicted Ser/Thr protein kinase